MRKSGYGCLLQDQWRAFEMLGAHELQAEAYWDEGRGARWVIGKPGTFHAKCEIFAGIGGSLVVHGDFDMVRFGHYGDRADAWSRLRWMADCTDVGYYVAQKASIGSRGRDSVEIYDEDVARTDLLQVICDYRRERHDRRDAAGAIRVLVEAARDHTESKERLYNFLYQEGGEWELWDHSSLGAALDPQVVISHVALNKCASLLRERHGKQGPPACQVVGK